MNRKATPPPPYLLPPPLPFPSLLVYLTLPAFLLFLLCLLFIFSCRTFFFLFFSFPPFQVYPTPPVLSFPSFLFLSLSLTPPILLPHPFFQFILTYSFVRSFLPSSFLPPSLPSFLPSSLPPSLPPSLPDHKSLTLYIKALHGR